LDVLSTPTSSRILLNLFIPLESVQLKIDKNNA